MFRLIVVPVAIATVCILGYMGSRILSFGLVKPEDVESPPPTVGGDSKYATILPNRKPVARSLTGRYKRVDTK